MSKIATTWNNAIHEVRSAMRPYLAVHELMTEELLCQVVGPRKGEAEIILGAHRLHFERKCMVDGFIMAVAQSILHVGKNCKDAVVDKQLRELAGLIADHVDNLLAVEDAAEQQILELEKQFLTNYTKSEREGASECIVTA